MTPADRERTRRWWDRRALTFGTGAVVSVLGAALTGLSGWLTWLTGSRVPHQSGYNTPAKFLLDSHAAADGVSLGMVILVLGILGVLAAVLAGGRYPGIVLGLVSVVVAGLFVYQLRIAVHDLDRAAHLGLRVRDVIGVGPFAAAAGGAVAVVGGLLPGRHPQPTPPSNTLA